MNDLKELLLSNIENTADWRAGKAVEYPDDAIRNNNCSEALRELHIYVEALPDEHALWQAMKKCIDYGVGLYSIGEKENYMLSRYGFFQHGGEDPEEFVAELTRVYEEALEEAQEEALDEAPENLGIKY
jgi:hypothetical protein